MTENKIVFAGLDSAGKTSFLNTLEGQYSTLMKIKPTLGPDRRELKLFGFTIQNWDLGGQRIYREKYLEEKDKYFSFVDTLFYIIDIQDKDRDDTSLTYLEQILNAFKEYGDKPNIVACLHKHDEDLQEAPEWQERVVSLKEQVQSIVGGAFGLKVFTTTIFEKWTLLRAFSQGIIGTSPKTDIIHSQLKEFARLTFSSAVTLLDANYLSFGSSTDNEHLLDISEAIVAQAAVMTSKLERYDIDTKNIVVMLEPGDYYKGLFGKELVVLYVPIMIEDKLFSLLSLTKNPKTMKLMLRHGEKLASNLKDIVKSFYH